MTIKYGARKALGLLLSSFGLGITGELIDLSDSPSGDLSLDDIFGPASGTSTTVEPGASTPPQPQVTTPDEPFLKAKTGTVYKSREEAVQGIEHKDALIAQLRDQLKNNTGQDPLRARQPETQQPVSYLENQDKYFEDIASAVERKDTKAYMDTQRKLILDTLGPIAPTITSLSRANAERMVANDIPEFKGFLQSDQYQQLAQDAPLLADAIRSAEGNPAAAAQLPELYRVAYLASQGRRVPELIQSVRNEQPVQTRPTVHSTPVPPPATTGIPVAKPSLDTKEGRKALMEQMEGRGVSDLRW